MSLDERARLRFHAWLREHDLDRETADAILRVMAPFDWHELATKADLVVRDQRLDSIDIRMGHLDTRMGHLETRLDRVETHIESVDIRMDRLETRMDEGFRELRVELGGLRHEVRTVLLALVGFMVTVFAAGTATAISLG